MNSDEATVAVIDALNALSVPYMLVGSLSSNFYGVPRATQDADFVVQLGERSIANIIERLGSAFQLEPQLSFEGVTATTCHIIKPLDIPFKFELFELSEDDYDRTRFGRRTAVQILGRDAFVPSTEDVIVNKLRWSQWGKRGKDLDDARNVIAVQGDSVDWFYVTTWCRRHDTIGLLQQIRESI